MKLFEETTKREDMYVCYNPQVELYAMTSRHEAHPSEDRRTEHIKEAWSTIDLSRALAAVPKLEKYSGLMGWEVRKIHVKTVCAYTATERIVCTVGKEKL